MAEGKGITAKQLAYVGIISGILAIFVFPIVLDPIAIIAGAIALTRATKEERKLCYFAIALGVIGLIALIVSVYFFGAEILGKFF